MSFSQLVQQLDVEQLLNVIHQATTRDIEVILSKPALDYSDFLRLLSGAARSYLPQISQRANALARQYFGHTIHLYVPLYLSNECDNVCAYCGFNRHKDIVRKTLTPPEILDELHTLQTLGFQHLLLLTGESPTLAGADYVAQAVHLARQSFPYVSLEIFAATQEEYQRFVEAGASGLTIYQETYHHPTYDQLHVAGPKKDYLWRLDAPERALTAGMRKVGLGALLGLYDWQYEAALTGAHVSYLAKKFWKAEFSVSFPRLRDVAGALSGRAVVDAALVQMIGAFRLYMPWVDLILSTREPAMLRDQLVDMGITQISAQSSTSPGGYTDGQAGEQFSVADHRSLEQIKDMLRSKGLDPVLKDWSDVL